MIDSKPFGPVKLTGEDAVLFKEDLEQTPPAAALRLLKRGIGMARDFAAEGEAPVAVSETEQQAVA